MFKTLGEYTFEEFVQNKANTFPLVHLAVTYTHLTNWQITYDEISIYMHMKPVFW